MSNPKQPISRGISDNLLTEHDASKISWRLLPDGPHGIRPIAGFEDTNLEEAHVVPLTGVGRPGFFIEGRTTMGYLAASETANEKGSSDWTPTHRAQYYDPQRAPASLVPLSSSTTAFGANTSGLKNSRGPTTIKRMDVASGAKEGQGQYLILFYNTGDKSYLARNPYWIAAGIEVKDAGAGAPSILFSQPEIAIYNPVNRGDRPGYPDFIENGTQVNPFYCGFMNAFLCREVLVQSLVSAILRYIYFFDCFH